MFIISFPTRIFHQSLHSTLAGSIPATVSGFFIDIKSFRSHYGPGVDSASNRNEFQEYFLGGKGGPCVRLTTYHHHVPLSRNLGTSTSWNPLGPSGPVTGLIYLYVLLYVASGHISVNFQNRTHVYMTVLFQSQRRRCSSLSLTTTTHAISCISVFLNRRAAARYRTLASIIPGRERFSWSLSF